MAVGVLALQGSFNEHIAVLRRLGVKGVEIRKAEQLDSVSSLIIPGGESTTMAKLAQYHNLFPALREFVKTGKPVWGTCAGLIFLANNAVGQKTGGQELIGGLDCTVQRNFFGSQVMFTFKVLYSSSTVEIQEEDAVPEKKVIVAVKQGNLLGTAFHPELTADTRWHSYFLKMASEMGDGAASSSIAPVGGESQISDQEERIYLPIFH
ncbi:LOW QUALITY PROTEIN: probable pyridoxal 5'-phosphate synthase subunit PDX2 [Carica papaya]|uniref:LOW QUALITY PROTEIN: probable pyridoxal 5'-phosphate synthase subunit PDX2 n=1 Tax=Carica papaya TaxID=3649 RepID=UPI000B8C802C|nr:LOW QUALITY PROTEIN: probable pyridoxal 5'-phosphate synthase subunit PDX2 [Carica papaya]